MQGSRLGSRTFGSTQLLVGIGQVQTRQYNGKAQTTDSDVDSSPSSPPPAASAFHTHKRPKRQTSIDSFILPKGKIWQPPAELVDDEHTWVSNHPDAQQPKSQFQWVHLYDWFLCEQWWCEMCKVSCGQCHYRFGQYIYWKRGGASLAAQQCRFATTAKILTFEISCGGTNQWDVSAPISYIPSRTRQWNFSSSKTRIVQVWLQYCR